MSPMAPLLVLVAAICAGCRGPDEPLRRIDGDAATGARLIAELECGVCHEIPGVRGARGTVGPSLRGFARRAYIAGLVPNEATTLVRWVVDAPAIDPRTLMPPMPLDAREARHVAAYLYTLR